MSALQVEKEPLTFQDSRLLGDADLPLGDDGFALRVADVGRDEGEAGLLLLPGAREVERQQLPVGRLKSDARAEVVSLKPFLSLVLESLWSQLHQTSDVSN